MVPRKRGSILFTGASASLRGRAGYGAFNSAKAGLRTFAQAMAKEYGPEGIHVGHVVVDGAVDGDKIRRRFPDAGSRRDRMLDIEGYGRVLYLSLPAAPQGLVLRGRRADVRGTLVS